MKTENSENMTIERREIEKAEARKLRRQFCDIRRKRLYLVFYTKKSRNWGQTLDQLYIYFEERIVQADIE